MYTLRDPPSGMVNQNVVEGRNHLLWVAQLVLTPEVEGLCYLHLVPHESWVECACALGFWPYLGEVAAWCDRQGVRVSVGGVRIGGPNNQNGCHVYRDNASGIGAEYFLSNTLYLERRVGGMRRKSAKVYGSQLTPPNRSPWPSRLHRPGPPPTADGWCYLWLFSETWWHRVGWCLGPNPTLKRLRDFWRKPDNLGCGHKGEVELKCTVKLGPLEALVPDHFSVQRGKGYQVSSVMRSSDWDGATVGSPFPLRSASLRDPTTLQRDPFVPDPVLHRRRESVTGDLLSFYSEQAPKVEKLRVKRDIKQRRRKRNVSEPARLSPVSEGGSSSGGSAILQLGDPRRFGIMYSVHPSHPGYCYLWAFQEGAWPVASNALGAYPKFRDLRIYLREHAEVWAPCPLRLICTMRPARKGLTPYEFHLERADTVGQDTLWVVQLLSESRWSDSQIGSQIYEMCPRVGECPQTLMPFPSQPGFCYLRLFEPISWALAVSVLGSYPTLGEIRRFHKKWGAGLQEVTLNVSSVMRAHGYNMRPARFHFEPSEDGLYPWLILRGDRFNDSLVGDNFLRQNPLVGGAKDCWKAFCFERENDHDMPIPLDMLILKYEKFLEVLDEPCLCDPDAVMDGLEDCPHIPPMMLNCYRLGLFEVPDGLHVEIYKTAFAEQNFNNVYSHKMFLKLLKDNLASLACGGGLIGLTSPKNLAVEVVTDFPVDGFPEDTIEEVQAPDNTRDALLICSRLCVQDLALPKNEITIRDLAKHVADGKLDSDRLVGLEEDCGELFLYSDREVKDGSVPLWMLCATACKETLVGLTTAVVLGTIGDVEPTLDVVAANHLAALTQQQDGNPWSGKFRFNGTGHGWCASDFLDVSPSFCKALDEKYGARKGTLEVTTSLWNEICSVWGGEPVWHGEQALVTPGGFPEDSEEVWNIVPERPIGPHERKLPEDFVLVTHPDHLEKLEAQNPSLLSKVETRPFTVTSHDFIKLGQDILQNGVWAMKDIKQMQNELVKAVQESYPVIQQSDLVYLVSGTTFHYFIGSLFPDKQVFEVCPVPREDNGTCPEFYLGHYASFFTDNPHFGFELGKAYNRWCMNPEYLRMLDWEGEFVYREPVKFHSIMPWAQAKWKIESPNVGFKPYDDVVRKTSWVEREKIKAYFSMGSCETVTKETRDAIVWLRSLNVEWFVDPRWVKLFEGCDVKEPGFFPHTEGLKDFDWVIHHGGSGTTNTCLAVDVPQTIIPQIGDQFIWQKALTGWSIPLYLEEAKLRAYLYHDRLPRPHVNKIEFLPTHYLDTILNVGGSLVEPFYKDQKCCHDWNEYGLKPLDLVVGEVKDSWITLFDTMAVKRGYVSQDFNDWHLKWVSKECKINAEPLPGWRGTNCNATYPRHAHGWLGDHFPREGIDSSVPIPDEWLKWLADQCHTARDTTQKTRTVRPTSGVCKLCRRQRELHYFLCSRCVGDEIVRAVNGEVPDLPPFTTWHKAKKKAPDKRNVGGAANVGVAIRSTRRYLQIDPRQMNNAPVYRLARAIFDRIQDLDDAKWCEAYWSYTNSWPPHYKAKTNPERTIAEISNMYVGVTHQNIMEDVVVALGKVLSVSSNTSIARRMLNLNCFHKAGWDIKRKKWHVLVDSLRHYSDLAREFGVNVLPNWVDKRFTELSQAKILSLIHYKRGIASPLRKATRSARWFETVHASGSKLMVHLFALKLPALGPSFGVFHAVVEYDGMFYELQQLRNETTYINKTKWQPEATPDRPLVKTIVVSEDVVGGLPMTRICREFDGNDYKILGDNCLVFANFLVYQLTGKIIPWRHFGVFGQDIPLELFTNIKRWACSHIFTEPDERRVTIETVRLHLPSIDTPIDSDARPTLSWGPKPRIKDYGLHPLRMVEATLNAYDENGAEDLGWNRDMLLELALLGYKRFGLSSHLVSQSLLKIRLNKIPVRRRKVKLIEALLTTFRKLRTTRLVEDMGDLLHATSELRMPLRSTRKPAWAPLVNIAVPHHWFKDKDRLVEVQHDPENLSVGNKKIVRLDLPQIWHRYKHYFDGVEFPNPGFKFVRPGEYEIGVKVPPRTKLPKMDQLTWSLVEDLQRMHPFEMGVFSLRFGTTELAEKVTDRYFTGTFDAGKLIPEEDQQALAEAIFENERHLYENAQLINPEEVYRKWHKNYSAGFPFRFNERGRASRQELIDACGGKQAFLEGVRKYIASPESFPTVSHAFIKDEVLPQSYIEREKIRTIIAQDPLNYYAQMAVAGDHAKRLDPTSFSAVGVSPAHGELAALAEKHLAYKHHFAMDVTALDSTAAIDAVDTIKRLKKLGFSNHPQRENIETLIDGVYTNLQASWIIDIHSGRARLKKQGLTTGHATTSASNTEYMKVMMLYAWGQITGRPYNEFYEQVKFSSFADDNFWSTNLPKHIFSAEKISEFWLSRGVQVRVEGESDDLSQLSFLAKKFSFEPKHLEEVRQYANRDARVAIVHDVNRLLQKFSDYKKKNTVTYRWEKMIALQANCAHHKDIYDKVDEYLDALEKEMRKRPFQRRFMKQRPRKSYADIMQLMYSPKNNKSGLVVSSIDESIVHKIQNWWDTIRVDIMAFDGEVGSYARVLQHFSGLLEIGGLNVEDPGVFLKQPGELPDDPELTLEHHVWLLNGCPGDFTTYRSLVQKTPFSAFCNIEKFWSIRDRFDISEECANGLRAKVLLLQLIYTMVAWLERMLCAVPVIGPMYKYFCTAKGMSEQLYSRLNALYYAMFGDSSLVLSSMMPKDRYMSLKVLAFRVWVQFTGTDNLDFAGDFDQFKGLADSAAKFAQDVHNLVFELDTSSVVPRPGNGEAKNTGVESTWQPLDHSSKVEECLELLASQKEPLVTGPTGCGKSTDFILNLYDKFTTVLVACPRRVLVKGSPIAQKRLYSGGQDTLTPGLVNFGTSGYFRQVLGDLDENTVLVLDEFHELDEDTLWLHSRFRGQIICVSATPKFQGSSRFTNVNLDKSRVSGHTVTTEVLDTDGKIGSIWEELNSDKVKSDDKVLCIVPRLRDVQDLTRHTVKMRPDRRVCELYRGHDVVHEADWYFATSIVDAGLTIPGLTYVIDTGWSSGWVQGHFTVRPSSHNTMDQRKGRTGRMCDGHYIRLQSSFNDTPFDFSTPFMFNHWEVVKQWTSVLKRPNTREPGCLPTLPAGYTQLLHDKDWSALIYLSFLYGNRGDVDRTRGEYQSARKFPDRPDVAFLVGPHQNVGFSDLVDVEERLRKYTIPGTTGNMWNWNGQVVYREDFKTPIPKHLQDLEPTLLPPSILKRFEEGLEVLRPYQPRVRQSLW